METEELLMINTLFYCGDDFTSAFLWHYTDTSTHLNIVWPVTTDKTFHYTS
jgi:hypothetical protein